MTIVLAMFAYMVYGVLMRLFEDSLDLFGKHDSGMLRFKKTRTKTNVSGVHPCPC